MKSFIQYLKESKDRFIKKNPHLTDDQKWAVISMFKDNRQAEKKVDWNKSDSMSYDDFLDVLLQFKSGRKKKLKNRKIKGLHEGIDYIAVRMKTKDYLAYIPLSYNAAQIFNTKNLGICSGDWCIGHSSKPYHWNEEVVADQQVPVYVINTRSKWVVMIQKGNRKYNIWTVENNPKKVREGIPDFSVRKELLNPKQKSMYDEIREDYYSDDAEGEEVDITAADADYNSIIDDINESANKIKKAQEYFDQRCYEIKRETEGQYDEEILRKQEKIESLESQKDEIEQFESEIEQLESEISSLQQKHDDIEDIENYEMVDSDIDWSDYPPFEEDIGDDINIPSTKDRIYSDYFDIMEEHGYEGDHNGCNNDILDHIMYSRHDGSSYSDGQEILSSNSWYHPDILND